MKQHYDIAIIGGGASGLSLLYAMHLQGILGDYDVALIEPEAKDSNDRTWSFWTDESDAAWQMFSAVVSKTWSKVEASPGLQEMSPFKYGQIRSKDFYAYIDDALLSYPKFDRLKARVEQLINGNPLRVITHAQGQLTADLVFDSRPPQISDPRLIWQSFVGYRIQSDQASFDTDVCRLMDFNVVQEKGLQFMYLLPTAKDAALIEFTRFGAEILTEEESLPIINDYLQKLGIESYTIEEKEIEKIPMSLKLNQKGKAHPYKTNYIPIGVRAGVVKASTGFAFKKIAQHSWELAIALKNRQALPKVGHPWNFWFYDELLLNLWWKDNSPIHKIFLRLFEVHPIDRILRFIDEKSHWTEDLRIMYNMPWAPFFWSIGRSVLRRLKM